MAFPSISWDIKAVKDEVLHKPNFFAVLRKSQGLTIFPSTDLCVCLLIHLVNMSSVTCDTKINNITSLPQNNSMTQRRPLSKKEKTAQIFSTKK